MTGRWGMATRRTPEASGIIKYWRNQLTLCMKENTELKLKLIDALNEVRKLKMEINSNANK